MKTKIVLAFAGISELNGFDQEVYIGKRFYKKEWSCPTIMKTGKGYEIEYCVTRGAARKLMRERENYGVNKELMYKSIKVESLI